MKFEQDNRSRNDLGRANRRAVMGEVVVNGPVSRTAIAAATGLTTASVSRITSDLIDAGIVMEQKEPVKTEKPGRRFINLDVKPTGGFMLGIGFNLFQQSVTLADLKNERVNRVDLSFDSLDNPDTVIERFAAVASEMITKHVPDRNRLFGGSVAVTGTVDPEAGIITESPVLDWKNVSMGPRLSEALGIPITVENLPNAINLAETHFGVARANRNVLLINASLGVGASLFLDGRMVRGSNFSAGMIAGLKQAGEEGGPERILDDLVGGWRVLDDFQGTRQARMEVPANTAAFQLLSAIRAGDSGDSDAISALKNAGYELGDALAAFCCLAAPETVVISGPLAGAKAYTGAAEKQLRRCIGKDNQSIDWKTCDTSAQAAARWMAISEFLINRDLDLENLKSGAAA